MLKALTLGPPCDVSRNCLHFQHPALESIERLRLCDYILVDAEVANIAGRGRSLTSLKHFQWSDVTLLSSSDRYLTAHHNFWRIVVIESCC